MGNQRWGRRELRGACSDLRDSSSGHCQGQDERETVGHWPGQLQKDPHGETRASGCSPPSRLCDSRSTVLLRKDGSTCNDWMLDLSTTRYTVCDRDLLEQNFGWNNMGDKHRVCVQWSADVCSCLRWPAHLPVARKIFTRTDGLMVLLWRFYDSSLSPSFCRGLALWSRTLSWKYTQFYLGAFFFFFAELIICFFLTFQYLMNSLAIYLVFLLGASYRELFIEHRPYRLQQEKTSKLWVTVVSLPEIAFVCSTALYDLHILEVWLSLFRLQGSTLRKRKMYEEFLSKVSILGKLESCMENR